MLDELIMDETTVDWPIPDDMSDDFYNIWMNYKVQPLPVYKDNKYVDPMCINATLKCTH